MNRDFTSDNTSAVAPAILAAIESAGREPTPSYGADRHTRRLGAVASEIFEREVAIFPVVTGTAANALALSQLVPPHGAIYCYEAAHIVTDECGAPELFTGGAKLIGLPGDGGKISPERISASIEFANEMGVHHVKPAAVSITQATEWGTIYATREVEAIAAVARRYGLRLHLDGARLANALARSGATPAEATWRAGVDVLSLGATKNGALCAEAVVFFDPAMAADFDRRRKRGGHLLSKLRFMSAQLLAYLDDGLWLANARHANAMAERLGSGIACIHGARLVHPVEANEVFAALPEPLVAGLEHSGFRFYRWPLAQVAPAVAIRLVTSFTTQPADVDALLEAARRIDAG